MRMMIFSINDGESSWRGLMSELWEPDAAWNLDSRKNHNGHL